MTSPTGEQDPALTPIKRALIEIRDLKARLAESERARKEPIAIVGMAMRFPGGVHDPASFASLLWEGTDAITDIPADRWAIADYFDADPDAAGKMITRRGGFVDAVDQFDAEFFGISPREAESMDPQQRLALHVAWEALEHAGYAPSALAGSRTGIYLGISNNDYGRAIYSAPDDIDPYFASGNAYSVAAGRISYFLGLHGPSLAVDSACSSSLVALHLACQAIRNGDCEAALAGGVNLILSPEMNITFSKARMMAPDGRCKTFDASADGYVRSEGCAFVVLRSLRSALDRRDNILAVVRGSAVNQDGRSGGLTAPNGPAQEAVIRAALEVAGIAPHAVSYVEAHGTGTSLGDPIEVNALGAVFAAQRPSERPLAIGSVKTNIGHLEAAAGIAGVIKVVLGLQRREIPPHLNFSNGNPLIDWASMPIVVPTAVTPWSAIDGARVAGVSSFGFSGTNAHVILSDAPRHNAEPTAPTRPLHVLALSARDADTLTHLSAAHVTALSDDTAVGDACFTANSGRSHFAHRVAVVGASTAELRDGLDAFVAGRMLPSVASSARAAASGKPRVAFVFTGQGAQSPGMGAELYNTSSVFRRALDAAAAALAPHLERGLLDVLFSDSSASWIHDTAYAQPATVALELALAQLWRSWGIEPDVVLGHSLGEYAAASFAGVFGDAQSGLRLVAARGQLTRAFAGSGAMAAVFASEAVVADELAYANGALEIAAYNGPAHFVISGARPAVDAAIRRLEAAGVRATKLRVAHAAHSADMDPVLAPFRAVLESVDCVDPEMPLLSNLTGALVGAGEITRPEYWLRHLREPVRFAQSIRAAHAMGITHFIEIGPHPVLLGMAAECLPPSSVEWLPSMRRDRPVWNDLLESVQRLYVDGADLDWHAFDEGYARRRIALPTYPFKTRRHWKTAVHRVAPSRPSSVTGWATVCDALDQQAAQGPLDLHVTSVSARWECLARLTDAHAVGVLRAAGLFSVAGAHHTMDQVLHASGIRGTYRHLVQRWLTRLVAHGILIERADGYVAARALAAPPMEALWAETEAVLADDPPLLAYVKQCGALMADVLTGRVSPLETLFPDGSFELAAQLYEQAAPARYVNALAASAVRAIADRMPAGHTVRVLEVGAGTGGTTSSVVRALSASSASYRFTDVSDAFLDRARERFHNTPRIEFGRFDLDADLADQGYTPESFDVIVSANAVHAVRDLRAALARLRTLLAPGGTLVLVESTEHLTYFDMTTGLIEGWQHFADDLRTDNPLLSPPTWVMALTDAGFARAQCWPASDSPASTLGQRVIVACTPGELTGSATSASRTSATRDAGAPSAATPHGTAATSSFRARFAEALEADRADLLRDVLRAEIMRVLRLDPSSPPSRHDRLMDLGMDSLMAVQFRNAVTRALELERALPATLMFDYPTIDDLVAFLRPQVEVVTHHASAVGTTAAAAAMTRPETASGPLVGEARIATMSDDEVAALLLQRLEGA